MSFEELIIKPTCVTPQECEECGERIRLQDILYRNGKYYHCGCYDAKEFAKANRRGRKSKK